MYHYSFKYNVFFIISGSPKGYKIKYAVLAFEEPS